MGTPITVGSTIDAQLVSQGRASCFAAAYCSCPSSAVVFGQVLYGVGVVREIEALDTDSNDKA